MVAEYSDYKICGLSGSKRSRLQTLRTQEIDFGNFNFKNKMSNLGQNGSNF